jgi:preprotein translocase subunit YajC
MGRAHCKGLGQALVSAHLKPAQPLAPVDLTVGAKMPGDASGLLQAIGLPVLLIALFYFMILRPQQKRAKEHQMMIANLKRGDMIELSSGIIGKVVRVEDKEVGVEVAQGVTVKVVKGLIAVVRTKGEPAPANDAKS